MVPTQRWQTVYMLFVRWNFDDENQELLAGCRCSYWVVVIDESSVEAEDDLSLLHLLYTYIYMYTIVYRHDPRTNFSELGWLGTRPLKLGMFSSVTSLQTKQQEWLSEDLRKVCISWTFISIDWLVFSSVQSESVITPTNSPTFFGLLDAPYHCFTYGLISHMYPSHWRDRIYEPGPLGRIELRMLRGSRSLRPGASLAESSG